MKLYLSLVDIIIIIITIMQIRTLKKQSKAYSEPQQIDLPNSC